MFWFLFYEAMHPLAVKRLENFRKFISCYAASRYLLARLLEQARDSCELAENSWSSTDLL